MEGTQQTAFGDLVRRHRRERGWTQEELAERARLSRLAIQSLEAGRRQAPRRDTVQQLADALGLHGAERARFVAVARMQSQPHTQAGAEAPVAVSSRRDDWGDAPEVAAIYGREDELATLARWVGEERCRLVALLGLGGIGKTALAARLARELAPQFEVVYWRSLRNAPPVAEWLAGAIAALSAGQAVLPAGFDARLGLLLELLRARRGLLVLDNLETILQPGEREARYRDGYQGYGEVLQHLAESGHQGCLLLTSREQPLRADEVTVRALHLEGLGVEDGRALLGSRALQGDEAAWRSLVGRYGGNPLALRVVGETIGVVFGGEIAAFLAQEAAVFGDIRLLLDEQVARLSPLERMVLTWLAVEREPVGFGELAADLGQGVGRAEVVEAIDALLRRSLLERGAQGAIFTLQPVVLEYVSERLIAALAEEIAAAAPALLRSHAVLEATSKDYVRQSQERLLAQPLLKRLVAACDGELEAERRLLDLLGSWRGRPPAEQGYGPGNVVNLLRLLRGDLRGLDLSRLVIRQAYLQETEAQGARLTGSRLVQSVLAEAFDQIVSVALSADGALLAGGASNGEVCLWRVADRTPIMALPGHAGITYAVALSADGRRLASGGGDGLVKLWDAGSGACLATMAGHIVQGVALSADGRLLAGGGEDGVVRLWEAEGGACLAALQGHRGVIHGVALSADGRLLASGGGDGTVRIWDIDSGTCRAILPGHGGAVNGVALSPDGRLALSGGADGMVRLWEVDSGRQRAAVHAHAGRVAAVALSRDGRLLASGGDDGMVRLWEAEGGACLAVLQGHRGVVHGVALSADGHLAASGASDGGVRLWAAPSGECLVALQGSAEVVWGAALAADGRLLASGGGDGLVRLWDAATGACQAVLRGHTGLVHRLALSADGQVLASGGEDGTIWLWNVQRRECLAVLRGHSGLIRSVAMSADGRLLASAGAEGTIRLWDVGRGEGLAVLEGHEGLIYRLAMSADGGLLASASLDGTVRLWEGLGWGCRRILRGHRSQVSGVALSADGRLLASGGEDGSVRLWDAASGACRAVLRGHTCWVAVVALSADGRLLASGGIDGSVRLWDAGTGAALASWDGHAGGVWGIVCSGDGQLLVTCGADGTVKLWATPSHAALRILRPDRLYERTDITGLTGVTAAQRTALLTLGAVEDAAAPEASPPAAILSALAPVPAQPPTNLSPARTRFVGRTADLSTLTQALDPATHAGTRLLTLIGVAGCGKTRLALAVADAVLDAYADGVWLVELAPLGKSGADDPTPVAAAAMEALGLRAQPGEDLLTALTDHLRGKRLLLVLDNCEHLIRACAAIASQLLVTAPTLQILATSHEALGTAMESVWRVAPLALPPAVTGMPALPELDRLAHIESLEFFVECAAAARPGFALTQENAASITAICRRLDGLPLALELAAARLGALSAQEVSARLHDRFRLLRHDNRAALPRHRTLQATMDWSYELLESTAQVVLRRSATFASGWTLEAAELVCAGDTVEPEAVLDALAELVHKSLIFVEEVEGTSRYGALETVRQYGWLQLERAGELHATRDRHLAWCVMLAEEAESELRGVNQAAWLARLEREHSNLRAALHWAMDQGKGAPGLGISRGLWLFWRHHGHLSEGRRWLAALLALQTDDAEIAIAVTHPPSVKAAAWLASDELDFAQEAALLQRGIALRRARGQADGLTDVLISGPRQARHEGDYALARKLLEDSLERLRQAVIQGSATPDDLAPVLCELGMVAREQGDFTRAMALFDECLALYREINGRLGVAVALLLLSDVARDVGEGARVRTLCEESLAIFKEMGHDPGAAYSLNNLALASYMEGDLTRAVALAEESATLFRRLNAGLSLAEVLVTVGRVRAALYDVVMATAALDEALRIAWAEGPRWLMAYSLEAVAILALRHGQVKVGSQLLGGADALRAAMGAPPAPCFWGEIVDAAATRHDTVTASAWNEAHALSPEELRAMALASLAGLMPETAGPGETETLPSAIRPPAPTNLPAMRTRLIGREIEQEALGQRAASNRLLTLTGAAGCGKTRLALALAERALDSYPDGVWLVELAALTASAGAAPIAAAIMAALGLRERAGQPLLDSLIVDLRDQRLLLVLDNCEHLIDACARTVERLLAASPGLHVLATSREALGLTGEMVWRVAPLALPAEDDSDPTAPALLETLAQSPAVQLFVERARAVRPGFALTAENAAVVVSICRRLDGLPLALELAAARLDVLSVRELAARLDDRFRLLRRHHAALPRHQTLQAAMEWSYDLLDAAERALLQRLAVFVGGWDLAAAETVCVGEAIEAEHVLDLLTGLVHKSLVQVEEGQGATRYRLLETVRQDVWTRFDSTGAAEMVCRQHALYALRLAEAAAAAWDRPDEETRIALLERDLDNVRAALRRLRDWGESALGLRLAGALWQFWRRRGQLSEGRTWLAVMLALDGDEEADAQTMAARATALTGAAWLASDQHDFARAAALLEESVALRRVLGHVDGLTDPLVNSAQRARAEGNYRWAEALLEEAAVQQRATGDHGSWRRGGAGLILMTLGLVRREQGNYAQATTAFEECLALHRASGERGGVAVALLGFGDIARDQGNAVRVRQWCEESLTLFQALGERWGVGFSLNNLALAAYMEGDLARAAALATESVALFRDLQAESSLAEALLTAGRIHHALGAAATARDDLAAALRLAWAEGPRWLVAASLEAFAVLATQHGQAQRAARLLGAAAALRTVMGAPLPPYYHAEIEPSAARARVALGEEAFMAASTEGGALPLEQAVAEALTKDIPQQLEILAHG
jgi:predicted ATPase/WD40 repeat protein/transcriptional regulator with XRE-family HTH domain